MNGQVFCDVRRRPDEARLGDTEKAFEYLQAGDPRFEALVGAPTPG